MTLWTHCQINKIRLCLQGRRWGMVWADNWWYLCGGPQTPSIWLSYVWRMTQHVMMLCHIMSQHDDATCAVWSLAHTCSVPGCGRCWQPRCTSLIHLLSHSPKRLVHIMYLFKSSASHSPILTFRSNLASYSTEKTGLIQDTVQTCLPPPLPSCTWAFLVRSVLSCA